MDSLLVLALVMAGLIGSIVLGIPIGIVLGFWASVGLFLVGGSALVFMQLKLVAYHTGSNYAWGVLPMFVWMGFLTEISGVVNDLFTLVNKWFPRLRGQLIYAVIAGGVIFGAASGSTVVSCVVFTKIALPEMLRRGYDRKIASGSIAASGILDALIPPSIAMVIFGMITDQSIGALLIGGIVPGILIAIMYAIITYAVLRIKPEIAPVTETRTFTWKERVTGLQGVLGIVILFGVVMGSIYTGFCTPTGAGGFGALGAFLMVIFRKKFSWAIIHSSLIETSLTTARLFLLLIGGQLFARYLSFSGISSQVVNFITTVPVPPFVVLIFVSILYLILGCFIDPPSMMVTTLPLLFPAVVKLGYDPLWFGIMVVLLVEIGLLTPPVGINVYSVASASEGSVKVDEVFAGSMPYLLGMVGMIILMNVFPEIVLWLPRTMMGK